MLTRTNRAIALATASAIALTAMSVTPASAGRRGNSAAAIAMFATVVGTIATIAAAEQRRSDWEARQRAYSYGYPTPPPYYGRPYYRPY